MFRSAIHNGLVFCQPPREAVSWNISLVAMETPTLGQPPREAVSWNNINPHRCFNGLRQPPREAVSWNVRRRRTHKPNICQPPREAVSWNILWYVRVTRPFTVSLLVRLWVEIDIKGVVDNGYPSASSWGCELKCREYNVNYDYLSQPPREAVSWNFLIRWRQAGHKCQPPREAVSWNLCVFLAPFCAQVSLLVRLWVEITFPPIKLAMVAVSLLVRLWVEMLLV